jgi:ribosome-binding factor A
VFVARRDKRSPEGSERDAGSGYRGQRLEELFREELNSLLEGEVNDPRLQELHITHVELSRDGSSARAWFVIDERASAVDTDDIIFALNRAAGFLRGRLCDALPLKRIPELRFRHDPAAAADEDSLPIS